ncbi:MAG: 30S ribosomal protein S6 [bacterium]|nr:30S ribosomal protein S6 [bacterium]
MDKEPKKYEIGFLVKLEEDKGELARILKDRGFSIIDDGEVSRIKLAYLIKKENFAFFGYLYFSGDPESVKELDKELKTSPKILRHLIISRPVIMRKIESKIDSEKVYTREISAAPAISARKITPKTEVLSNEELEKKLEEILK